MANIVILLLLLCATVWAGQMQRRDCDHDNCLRAVLNDKVSASASSFCSTFLGGTVTATTALPTYLSNCGTQTVVNRVSSACSCLVGSGSSSSTLVKPSCANPSTSEPSSTTLTTTTTKGTTISTTSTTSNTKATTTSAPSTCPAASTITSSITVTSDIVVNITTTITTVSNITITLPPTTVSEPPVTDIETVSITESPVVSTTTLTQTSTSTSTTTKTVTTVGPEPSTCNQPVPNSGFENPAGLIFPWSVAVLSGNAGSSSNALGQPSIGAHSGQVSLLTTVSGGSSYELLMWTTITGCPEQDTKYQPSMWILSGDTSAITINFTMSVYGTFAGSPTSAPVRELNSNVVAVAGLAWTQVTFGTFTLPGFYNGVVQLVFGSPTASYDVWFDDITMAVVT